jgi:hypothetical protein
MHPDDGFSLLEVTIAIALTLVVTATVFALLRPSETAFSVVPEVADMQQRLRVATDTLYRDLILSGAGLDLHRQSAGLQAFFAPVLPFRRGAAHDPASGPFTTDSISLLYVPAASAQTTISAPVVAASAALTVEARGRCPRNADGLPKPLCGFEPGARLLIVDEAGRYDLFTVTAVNGDAAQLAVDPPSMAAATIYPIGSTVVEVVARTYSLRVDAARRVSQLVSSDGPDRGDVPVVDDVVALTLEYFGDPQPPLLEGRAGDPDGRWTSYGPKPPPDGVKTTAYAEGENCTFTHDADGNQAPRLAVLGDSSNPYALVKLTEAQLTDGPWCPDTVSPNGFDADLLRIRAIAVTLRVQAATAALRGPAGALFRNGGTAHNASRWVPDQEVRFVVAPRNLNLRR